MKYMFNECQNLNEIKGINIYKFKKEIDIDDFFQLSNLSNELNNLNTFIFEKPQIKDKIIINKFQILKEIK